MEITIVSGGQSGVDRGAFDVALAWGIPMRGWVPYGRKDESGKIDLKYPNLRETESEDNSVRTFQNVRDSHGTLIIVRRPLVGGTKQAAEYASQLHRPLCVVDLSSHSMPQCIEMVLRFLRCNRIIHLNVGGPRASEEPEIYGLTVQLLSGVLTRLSHEDQLQTAHIGVAIAMFEDASANFRHWDQLRWIVPTWFITLFAGLAALSGLDVSERIKENIQLGSLAIAVFGALCVGLEVNLVSYHNNGIRSLRRKLERLSIDTQSREILADMNLPFEFKIESIWRTATFWFLLAMLVVVAICLVTAVLGPWWTL